MKLLLFPLVVGCLWAADSPKPSPQPTDKERAELLQAQRDYLLANEQAKDAATKLQSKATELATKYNCDSWNPDFTCVPKKEEAKKADKK